MTNDEYIWVGVTYPKYTKYEIPAISQIKVINSLLSGRFGAIETIDDMLNGRCSNVLLDEKIAYIIKLSTIKYEPNSIVDSDYTLEELNRNKTNLLGWRGHKNKVEKTCEDIEKVIRTADGLRGLDPDFTAIKQASDAKKLLLVYSDSLEAQAKKLEEKYLAEDAFRNIYSSTAQAIQNTAIMLNYYLDTSRKVTCGIEEAIKNNNVLPKILFGSLNWEEKGVLSKHYLELDNKIKKELESGNISKDLPAKIAEYSLIENIDKGYNVEYLMLTRGLNKERRFSLQGLELLNLSKPVIYSELINSEAAKGIDEQRFQELLLLLESFELLEIRKQDARSKSTKIKPEDFIRVAPNKFKNFYDFFQKKEDTTVDKRIDNIFVDGASAAENPVKEAFNLNMKISEAIPYVLMENIKAYEAMEAKLENVIKNIDGQQLNNGFKNFLKSSVEFWLNNLKDLKKYFIVENLITSERAYDKEMVDMLKTDDAYYAITAMLLTTVPDHKRVNQSISESLDKQMSIMRLTNPEIGKYLVANGIRDYVEQFTVSKLVTKELERKLKREENKIKLETQEIEEEKEKQKSKKAKSKRP